MKTTAIVALAAAVGVAAQAPAIPDGTPDCVATCAKNMLAKTDLGCSAGDIACLCQNKNFYGVRDCTWAACNNNQGNLDTALKWLASACPAGSATAIPSTPGAAAPTTTGGATAGAPTPTPVTTSTFTSVVTDASGAVVTQVGTTTINGLNGTPGATVVTTSTTASVTLTGSGFTSTVATTFATSATVVPSDVSSSLSSAAAGSTTSSGLGAQYTAAPAAGFLAAAGIAALLL